MVDSEKKLFARLNGETALAREKQRLKVLSELGLLEAETIPVFEEATQTAAHFLGFPICILGFVDQNRLRVRSAVGLSRIGLMNQLAQERQLPRDESFCTHVVETHQVLAIGDALSDPDFAKSVLVQHYGIRAYLGVPLMDAAGNCLGVLCVMERSPRIFTIRDIEFLELMARWSMSEFERNWLLKFQVQGWKGAGAGKSARQDLKIREESPEDPQPKSPKAPSLPADPLSANQVKLELVRQLTQELRTPLTSVLGMASVVGSEIYGALTSKQKKYVEIIQNSGMYLLALVNEISELGGLDESNQALNLTSVDIEMLCQQVINTLSDAANRREQKISLSVEPGRSRTWVLDKNKIRQMLYHLVMSVIETANNGSVEGIHVSHKSDGLNIAVGVSHPWLGDGLTQVNPECSHLSVPIVCNYPEAAPYNTYQQPEPPMLPVPDAQSLDSSSESLAALADSALELTKPPNSFHRSRESLRLLLSYHLAQLQGGKILIQGTPESGYRYLVTLPELKAVEENI